MGPHSDGYLFQSWLPARALPLVARAACAIEMTGTTRKDVAAAVGGMNCSTSVSACSNRSLDGAVALRGCRGKDSISRSGRTGEVKGRNISVGGKMCFREAEFLWHKTGLLPT